MVTGFEFLVGLGGEGEVMYDEGKSGRKEMVGRRERVGKIGRDVCLEALRSSVIFSSSKMKQTQG